MKRSIVLIALLVSACSHTSPMSPTVESANVPTSGTRLMKSKSLSSSGVVFASDQIGKVTITNDDSQAHRFAFYIWNATDEQNQQLEARIQQAIAPGQTATLTVGFAQTCGTKYQRDVYVDVKDYEGATSEAETRNYFFAAPGTFWQSELGACDVPVTPPQLTPPVTPPPPPPPATCQDQTATNFGGALPCTYAPPPPPPDDVIDVCPNIQGVQTSVPEGYELNNGGQCVPVHVDPPPPPPGPQTFAFCHIEYNTHTEGRDHHVVTNFIHEQNLNITLQAITNGHSDPAHHSYDHYGACTGSLAPVITQGPQ